MDDWRTPRLLGPACAAARKVLRDLEPDDVPASLRRVAAHSGRRLPPPLAVRLIESLDENEWLREKTAEAAEDLDADSADPATAVSALFLLRPDGWETRAEQSAELSSAGTREALIEDLRKRIADLERQLEAARGKARAAQARVQETEAAADKRRQTARATVEAARREERQSAEDLRRAHAALSERHRRVADELEEAGDRIAHLRDELLRLRRSVREEGAAPPGVWASRDPVSLAALLDEITRAVRPEALHSEPSKTPEPAEPFALPVGVAPDTSAALRWLLTRTEPSTLVVDGYNVTYLLNPEGFVDLRDRLNEGLARFRRMAAAPVRAIVVYDSGHEGAASTVAGPGGVEVRFTEAGHSADEEILRLASELGGDVAVVSTDRTVREGAEGAGALGLWSRALVEWLDGR